MTHHVWLSTKETEDGPHRVDWMAYRSRDEFLELLALIKSLGDQINSIWMHELGGIQFQDLLHLPFKMRRITRKSPHEHKMTAGVYWQIRMLDLPACVAHTRLGTGPISFNLALTDPIESLSFEETEWSGISGDYIVTLGPTSSAAAGRDAGLPTLRASVGAFTRMWLGVRSATALSWTDQLDGRPALLAEFDGALRLPAPTSDWDF
ncbi:MAG: hypothetical protein WBC63_07140 [Candidatus Bipolaricaulia bacterium]